MQGTAIVTGGTRGIGFATAQALLSSGLRVSVCSEDAADSAEAAKRLGRGALGLKADVTSAGECEALFEKTMREFGSVDFLVNSAGIGFLRPLADTAPEDIALSLDVNVKGVLYCCRMARKFIRRGAVVNISSFYGRSAAANASVYCASKFAVMGLSKALAAEFYPDIKVFVVAPGEVDTRMLREGFGGGSRAVPPEKIVALIAGIIERWETTETGTVVEAWKPGVV